MKWSLKIGKIAGTELRVHVTFFLLLVWLGAIYYMQGGTGAALIGVAFILAVFACVLLHELGHALAARSFGIATPDITLLPIGGVARLQRMPERPVQEIIVALAGPAVNVVIAGVLVAVVGRVVDPSQVESLGRLNGPGFLATLAAVNLWIVLFNLLPAFPMDGGRVLRAVLASFMRYGRATQIAARIGQGMALVFGFAGLFINPLLVIIAVFIYLGASAEAAHAQLRELSRGLTVADAMITEFVTLTERSTLAEAVEMLLRTSQHEFPVLDAEGRLAGILTRNDMLDAYRRGATDLPVSEAMHTQVPTASAEDDFGKAFRLMQEQQCPALAVMDGDHRLVGLVTTENVGEMMMIQSALPHGHRPAWRSLARRAA